MNPQAEYYKIRLDHTLQHTQQATRLIYLANGAVLAALYFIVEKIFSNLDAPVAMAEFYLLELLALMNLIHSALILRQGKWYRDIDIALARSVSAERVSGG